MFNDVDDSTYRMMRAVATEEGDSNDQSGEIIISNDVDCPWCSAKAGEDCWDYDPETGTPFRMHGRGRPR